MNQYSRISKAIRKRREARKSGLILPYQLGKKPAKIDKRNILFAKILKILPPVPEEYSVDANLPDTIPTPMFANDEWGDCVKAARAHQTLRFEDFEQKKVIKITDDEVLREYWDEQSSWCKCFNPTPDKGLVLLDSLKDWRNDGWIAAGEEYNIYAFAEISRLNHSEVKAAIYLLTGAQVGIQLPISAQEQFRKGQVWEVVLGPDSIPGSWGGHGIAIEGYNHLGVCCITWAKKQWMTWRFWDTYVDECYGIVDNVDPWLGKDSPVDIEKLNRYLEEIS